MRNDDLEREILAAPDDPQAYLVYADWLQTQGDPRGELIVRQHEGREADSFLDEHRAEFLGRFASETPETFVLEWRRGYIKKATIGWEMFGGEDADDTSGAQLAAFLALESARFIEELALGPTADDEEMTFDGLAAAIEQARPLALRTLYLGDTSDWDISSTSTRLPSCASIRGLRSVTLRGGNVTLGAIELPELRSFCVETGGLTQTELRELAAATWPLLEELEIWFGDPNYGASGSVADILPIFAGTGLAKLRKLRLKNCPFADDVATQLARAAVLPQLEEVDLSMGNLSDRGVAAMLDARDRFAHLAKLNLDDNALTDASWPAARPLAKTVVFGTEQNPDRAVPRDADRRYRRFVSVGE